MTTMPLAPPEISRLINLRGHSRHGPGGEKPTPKSRECQFNSLFLNGLGLFLGQDQHAIFLVWFLPFIGSTKVCGVPADRRNI